MGRIIAIDYGTKRTGIAATDELQLIASGLATVETGNLIAYLTEYLNANDVDVIVVGEPRQKDGTPSEVETEIQKFLQTLERTLPAWPIARMDERFTSKMAFQSMIEGGLSKKQRKNKALVDEISATIILQDYLRSKKGQRNND